MKLSITDEFLWHLYDFLEKGNDVVDFFFFSNYMKKSRIVTGGENPLFKRLRHEKGRQKFSQLIYKAKVSGLIKVKNLEGKKAVVLTNEGIGRVLKASFAMEGKKRRKDGKWIMIAFDVPAKQRKTRDLLRSILRNLEYKILQQSVWVCPYNVQEKTEKLLQFHNLDQYVKIFLIEEL